MKSINDKRQKERRKDGTEGENNRIVLFWGNRIRIRIFEFRVVFVFWGGRGFVIGMGIILCGDREQEAGREDTGHRT